MTFYFRFMSCIKIFSYQIMVNHYKTLGLSSHASSNEIKQAYQKLAIKWHPDKNPKDPHHANKKFKAISEAYEILSDKSKRRQYDYALRCRRNSKRRHRKEGNQNYIFELKDLGQLFRKFVVSKLQEVLFLPLKKAFFNRSSRRFAAAFQDQNSFAGNSESLQTVDGVHATCNMCNNRIGVASTSTSTSHARIKKKKRIKTKRMLEYNADDSNDEEDSGTS